MTVRELDKAKWRLARKERKESRIKSVLARTPYTPDSALYLTTKKEMMALSDDAVYLISLAR